MIGHPSVSKKVVVLRGKKDASFKAEGVAFCTRSAKRKREETSPSTTGSKKVEKCDLEEFTCGICFDECTDRGVIDCCDHKFCCSCIKTWMERSSSCPHCKRQVQTISRIDRWKRKLVEKVDRRILRETVEREEGVTMGRLIVLGPVPSYQGQRFVQDPSQVYNMLVRPGGGRYPSNELLRTHTPANFVGNAANEAYVLSQNIAAATAAARSVYSMMRVPPRQPLRADFNMLAPGYRHPMTISPTSRQVQQFECNMGVNHGVSPGVRSVHGDYASRRMPMHPFLGSPFSSTDMGVPSAWNRSALNSVPLNGSSRLSEATPNPTCLFQQTNHQISRALNIQALLTSQLFGGSNML